MKNGQKWSKMAKNDQYLIKNDQKTTKIVKNKKFKLYFFIYY